MCCHRTLPPEGMDTTDGLWVVRKGEWCLQGQPYGTPCCESGFAVSVSISISVSLSLGVCMVVDVGMSKYLSVNG